MLRKTILPLAVILVAIWATATAEAQAQALSVTEIDAGQSLEEQAAQYKAMVLMVLANRATSLPLESAVAAMGVLEEAYEQLDACAASLKTNQLYWQYKMCASTVLQQGHAELSMLQATSGAASTF